MSDLEGVRQAARQALFWRAVESTVKAHNDSARVDAAALLAAAEIGKQNVVADDGTLLGSVSWTPALGEPKVTSPAALLAWVKRNRPSEVVVTEAVRPAYVEWLLGNARANPEGVPIDPETGAVVPGVTTEAGGAGRLTVRPTVAAKERVRDLMGGAVRALVTAQDPVSEDRGYTDGPEEPESV